MGEILKRLHEDIHFIEGLNSAGATLTVALYVYAKEEGEFEVALIEEERNGQRYAGKSILRRGDKYYLSSYRFD